MFDSPFKDSLIVLVILLLFFGPKRLPALSRSIGESVREFRSGIAHASGPEQQTEIPSPPAEPATTSESQAPSGSEQRTGV
ncbi:MAG: Sec-independent protein translocase subunit TatA/TatB [Solirubrobacteraceae bacterium]